MSMVPFSAHERMPVTEGLDSSTFTLAAGLNEVWPIIEPFQMPPVSPTGPLYFYAAMFEPGTLSLDTLVSNGAAYEFYLQ